MIKDRKRQINEKHENKEKISKSPKKNKNEVIE